jgi:hypothetical protein
VMFWVCFVLGGVLVDGWWCVGVLCVGECVWWSVCCVWLVSSLSVKECVVCVLVCVGVWCVCVGCSFVG